MMQRDSIDGGTEVNRQQVVAILKNTHTQSQAASQKALGRPLAASPHVY